MKRKDNFEYGRNERNNASAETPEPHRVRLPGFLIEDEIGIGDVIKRATYILGIKSCGGCERRSAILNRWISFSR